MLVLHTQSGILGGQVEWFPLACRTNIDDFIGSSIRHKNQTYQEAFAFNNAVEPRTMAKPSIHGLEWCCEWLHYGLGIARGCPY